MTISQIPHSLHRNASLRDLANVLHEQQDRKLDIIAPAPTIRAEAGHLIVQGADHKISADGVTACPGTFQPTEVCDNGIAEKLGIPSGYLRRTRREAPDLWDANVNGWLSRSQNRSFMVRTLRPHAGGAGVARAFLSNGYRIIDNYDILTAALDGVRQAKAHVRVHSCDLTDQRMYIRIVADEIRAYAPELLRNYRSPFSGNRGADNPTVFAGLQISNSETGCGAFTIVPRLIVEVCDNGLTITKDATRNVHIGGRQDDGIVKWSDRTRARTLDLVTSQTADAVRTFLNPDYIGRQLHSLQAAAAVRIKDPEATITTVAQRLKFTEERRKAILNHFIEGADITAGGVLHAVTSVAQTLPDADQAHEMESTGLRAMELAAAC